MRCNKCPNGSYFNGNECEKCSNCLICNNGKCELCESGFILNEFKCINSNEISNCEEFSEISCLKCSNGYYYDTIETNCKLCSEEIEGCLECLNSTTCLTCNNETYLENGKCYELTKEITNKCIITIPGKSNQCAICKNGYYMTNLICKECISNCSKCYDNK